MSKSEKPEGRSRKQEAGRDNRRPVFSCLLLSAVCLLSAGCRQDMQDQPRYEAYESSTFFKDGLASRQLPEGTVPRGYLRTDTQLYTGQFQKAQAGTQGNTANTGAQGSANAQGNGTGTQSGNNTGSQGAANTGVAAGSQTAQTTGSNNPDQPAGEPNDVEEFPFPVTEEVVERGKERYEIFCAMCHGYTGDGDGMIVRRGFKKPPSYHIPRLQPPARVGYFFRVITDGFGAMPSYKSQVPVQDRWAIISYIRALQLSRMNQQTAPAAVAPANTEGGGHE